VKKNAGLGAIGRTRADTASFIRKQRLCSVLSTQM